MTSDSLDVIGQLLGGRDHSTIIHGIKKVTKDYEENDSTRTDVYKRQSLVVPAISVTIALSLPTSTFKSDDFPAFGFPMITVFIDVYKRQVLYHRIFIVHPQRKESGIHI